MRTRPRSPRWRPATANRLPCPPSRWPTTFGNAPHAAGRSSSYGKYQPRSTSRPASYPPRICNPTDCHDPGAAGRRQTATSGPARAGPAPAGLQGGCLHSGPGAVTGHPGRAARTGLHHHRLARGQPSCHRSESLKRKEQTHDLSNVRDSRANSVLGQKYAYATAALLVGIASFISLLGAEKAILAVIFAVLALKSQPQPALRSRRTWARAGLALGILFLVFLPTFLLLLPRPAARDPDGPAATLVIGKAPVPVVTSRNPSLMPAKKANSAEVASPERSSFCTRVPRRCRYGGCHGCVVCSHAGCHARDLCRVPCSCAVAGACRSQEARYTRAAPS